MDEFWIRIEPVPLLPLAALSVTFIGLEAELMLEFCITMSRAALIVSERGDAALTSMFAVSSQMSPLSALVPPLPVVMVTWLPGDQRGFDGAGVEHRTVIGGREVGAAGDAGIGALARDQQVVRIQQPGAGLAQRRIGAHCRGPRIKPAA